MGVGRRVGWIARALACAALVPVASPAADIGGWFADQQKASAQAASNADPASCPQVIARAARDTTALGAYQAATCYLQAETPDVVAAKAWLSRSAALDFLPAQRLLRSLQAAEAGAHAAQRHCHELGEGRQICHGGAPPPLAAAATN